MTSALAEAGHRVFVLSRGSATPLIAPNPDPQDPPGKVFSSSEPYTLIRADLAAQTPAEIASLLPDELDAVVHAASCNETFLPGYAQQALNANALGTRNLLEALELRADDKRALPLFVYCSTFHVYGALDGHITEEHPLCPLGDYALTHLFAEEYCRMFMRTKGLPHITIRLSNGYGAPKTAHSDKWYLLLNDLCRQAATLGRICLKSGPSASRDFIWLGDVAATAAALVLRPDLAGRVFNVASGTSISLGEVARRVAAGARAFFNKDIPLELLDENGVCSNPSSLRVDNSAIRAALNLRFHDRMTEEVHALLAAAQAVGSRF